MREVFYTAFAVLLLAGGAQAAEKCYEPVWKPASMECQGGESNSADFSGGCAYKDAGYEDVEVECPQKGLWVNAFITHHVIDRDGDGDLAPGMSDRRETCASVGMKPSSIDGYICASGNKRPNFGNGWEDIKYIHGTRGNRNVGGTSVSGVGSKTYIMCTPTHYGNGDRTNIADAYYCE